VVDLGIIRLKKEKICTRNHGRCMANPLFRYLKLLRATSALAATTTITHWMIIN